MPDPEVTDTLAIIAIRDATYPGELRAEDLPVTPAVVAALVEALDNNIQLANDLIALSKE